MSIDTAAKRACVGGVILPFLVVGVTPSGSDTAFKRAAAGWSYSFTAVLDPIQRIVPIYGVVDNTRTLTGTVRLSKPIYGTVRSTVTLTGVI